MSIQIIGSVYSGGGKPGDFGWMMQQPAYDDAFFVFNDNEECFVAHQQDPKAPQGCAPGGGNAAIRPYQCSTSRVLGIPTGTLNPFQGYPVLTPHVKGLIDSAIAVIRDLMAANGTQRLFYSAANAQGDLGGAIFVTAPDVKYYIVSQIRTLGTVSGAAPVGSGAGPSESTPVASHASAGLQPQPQQFTFGGKTLDYLGFYYPGNNTDWDNVYGVPCFGNFWVHPFNVQLNGVQATFHTAEAAYQASKWWADKGIRQAFETCKTGPDAFGLRNELERSKTSFKGAFGGYASGEDAMFEILKCKFSDPELQSLLGKTGHAYLLEHAAVRTNHQDFVWSDGNSGKGTNHLGLALMKVRNFYFSGQGNPLDTQSDAAVVLACTTALRAEMTKRGLSADSATATR